MEDIQIGREKFLEQLAKHVSPNELQTIEDAYTLAKYGHRNQSRDQGGRYFEHPKNVALIIMNELDIYDAELIEMALLHDVLEDTFILSRTGLAKLFGERVMEGLDILTKVDDVETYTRKIRDSHNTGAIIVKFADRLHNLRTYDNLLPEKKQRKIKETQDLYLPILDKYIHNSDGTIREALEFLKSQILETFASK